MTMADYLDDSLAKPPSDDHSLLVVEKVHRIFEMGEVKVPVLKGISFEVTRGEILAIVGPSGSGKTTVLNLIGGLDQPNSGHVWYMGEDLAQATSSRLTSYRREEVGFVFQLYNLVPNLTARENIMVSTEISSDPMDPDQALEMVGLSDRKHHFPSQMSGGEQQRVAIARAIAKNPSLLLCDEPTGALDFETGRQVLSLLVELNQSLQKTIIIITHNAALSEVASRVIHLHSGEVAEVVHNATPKDPAEVVW